MISLDFVKKFHFWFLLVELFAAIFSPLTLSAHNISTYFQCTHHLNQRRQIMRTGRHRKYTYCTHVCVCSMCSVAPSRTHSVPPHSHSLVLTQMHMYAIVRAGEIRFGSGTEWEIDDREENIRHEKIVVAASAASSPSPTTAHRASAAHSKSGEKKKKKK